MTNSGIFALVNYVDRLLIYRYFLFYNEKEARLTKEADHGKSRSSFEQIISFGVKQISLSFCQKFQIRRKKEHPCKK